jgi:hypothetical protein
MVDGNKLGDVGFKYIGTPYSTMDCQAFVEKCLSDCGMYKNLPGSNAWYREVYNHGAIFSPEDCVRELGCVPKGAFLFILEHDGKEPEKYKKDGLGNASHIGICTEPRGEGAIHSSKSKGGVCESKFKNKTINGGWNKVGLWDQVSYDYGGGGTPAPEPEPEPHETLYATVYAENGKPVKLRTKPSTNCSMYWEIPCGTQMIVDKQGPDWCAVQVADNRNMAGYMMTKFLMFEEDPEPSTLYTVTIRHLPEYQAQALRERYDGAVTIEKE